MKREFWVNLIAGLIVGILVAGYFWVMVQFSRWTGLSLYFVTFVAVSVKVTYLANKY